MAQSNAAAAAVQNLFRTPELKDKILFTLHPAKNGEPYGQGLTVTLPNGTVMQAVQGLLPADLEPTR